MTNKMDKVNQSVSIAHSIIEITEISFIAFFFFFEGSYDSSAKDASKMGFFFMFIDSFPALKEASKEALKEAF